MSTETKLHRTLGPVHLWGIAVGLVISGDYFGWNFGWSVASFWEFAIAVFLVAIFYICFALCFTELSSSIPHAGGPSAYAEQAFGKWGGFISGYFVLCEFALAPPAIASALGGYFHFLFPDIPIPWASFGFFFLLVCINLLGVKQTSRFELFVTVVAVLGLLIYLLALLPYFSFSHFPEFPGVSSLSFSSLFASIPFAIWFFLAVEGVAMSAEEVRNPPRDIPIGYAAGIGTLILLASCVFVVTAGVVPTIEVANIEYPLSYVLKKIYGEGALVSTIFTFIGLFGLIASLFGIILGYSRLVYALSLTHYLPKFLSKISRHNLVPNYAVLSGGILGFACLAVGDTAELITASALGACGMYVVSMLAYFVLKIKEPNRNRPYVAPLYPFVPILAMVLGVVAFFAVAFSNVLISIIVGLGLVGALGLFLWLGRKSRP
ncbi:ethanolamine permease [Leptospira ognonensis]|uniref:Ethanolamine permease n=1 Tax=Leptospira ognonensis TaxID=2484945 RepID=A0A4R9K4M9_9LEPT|nr:ethanolamine permease [Leptospira ognonensis]TGL60124.1 ethanolamine permease [Leptospira ognonensis]